MGLTILILCEISQLIDCLAIDALLDCMIR